MPAAQNVPKGQTRPQVPQLASSVRRSTQRPEQFDCPGEQQIPPWLEVPLGQQMPIEQNRPLAQALLQTPQWLLLVRWSTHAPLQTDSPLRQAQTPLLHAARVRWQQGVAALQAAPIRAHGRQTPRMQSGAEAQQSASLLQAVPWQAAAGAT